jgi:dephospho-CoA kinase
VQTEFIIGLNAEILKQPEWRKWFQMIVAGLTGGIASGKSTVADILRKAGAVIIDADLIARQIVAPGQPAWREIRSLFGTAICRSDGQIDRDALGKIVFDDPPLRQRLEAITHPRVGAQMAVQLQCAARNRPEGVVIMDIPLLFESGKTEGLAEIIVVYVPQPIQRQRLMQRNGFDTAQAEARIRSQMPLDEKARKATMVIDNSGTLAQTETQTLAIYRKLAQRA